MGNQQARRAPHRPINLVAVFLLLTFVGFGCASERRPAQGRTIPQDVAQAVKVLKAEWLSADDVDWILRNTEDSVAAELHFGLGVAIRNDWGLWKGNRELMNSCSSRFPQDCSDIIIRQLWASIRREADQALVEKLDCQFRLTESIRIRYAGFYAMRVGEMLRSIQEQMDAQLPMLTSRSDPECERSIRLLPTGNPDLACFTRAEFSEDGCDPVSLAALLGWIGWRNGFGVRHVPPNIELPFRDKCEWSKLPAEFSPPGLFPHPCSPTANDVTPSNMPVQPTRAFGPRG